MKEDFTNGKVNMEKYYHKPGTNGDVSLLNLSKNHYLQCLKL
jgi:CO dehydrogenase/acetyl-CoA synthase epsilon subunit